MRLLIIIIFAINIVFAQNTHAQGIVPGLLWRDGTAQCNVGIKGVEPDEVFAAAVKNYEACLAEPQFKAVVEITGSCKEYREYDNTVAGSYLCPACVTYYNHDLPPYGGCSDYFSPIPISMDCPSGTGYSLAVHTCVCPKGQAWSADVNRCVSFGDRTFNKPQFPSCPSRNPAFGNPIYPLTGIKRQQIDTDILIGGKPLQLTYDNSSHIPEASQGQTWLVPPLPSFGPQWQSNFHRSVVLQGGVGIGAAYSTVALQRGNALWETSSVVNFDTCTFDSAGGGSSIGTPYVSTVDPNQKLVFAADGSATLLDGVGLAEELYDTAHNIQTIAQAQGIRLTFEYNAGNLTSVSDSFGRRIVFGYEQPDIPLPSRISTITATDGSKALAGYDSVGNLKTLTWADNQVRTFLYERPDLSWALTGILDEDDRDGQVHRFATYDYDTEGRAISTFQGAGVDKYTVTYGSPPKWVVNEVYIPSANLICREHRWQPPTDTQVTMPNGTVSLLNAGVPDGMVALQSQNQPAGSGCSASSSSQGYDTKGNVTSLDDFNSNRSCYAYDLSRNLRAQTLEGLPTSKACPSALIPGPVDGLHPERLTTTAWHPDWVLKTREAEPKKLTTWVYNGQPDPIAGGTASCAPGTATLPDGKPIAVLCARYEQATTDATGASGFSATVAGAVRKWSFTYNAYGQVLTEVAPKLSSSSTQSTTTTYAYYPDTAFSGAAGHTLGDLKTLTNPLGQITTFSAYDKAGRLLASTDANGVVTTQTYWPRGWLHTQTVTPASGTARATTYDYWPTGLLHVATLADGTTLSYTYDDAHRLTDVVDGAGNLVHYVLDNLGNRTSEQMSDASGALAASVARVFDNLNRVQATTGALH